MSLKYGIVFAFLLFILFSCSHSNKFPSKLFEKVADENVVLTQSFISVDKVAYKDSVENFYSGKDLDELVLYKKYYENRNENFNLPDFEDLWGKVKKQRNNFSFDGVNQWIKITGFLLEITGNARYARELEETIYQCSSLFPEPEFMEIEKLVIPWIFTKNVDHIHVNLFANATIKYEHSMKGAVEITQETDYPKSGKIQVKFKLQTRNYIEFFIRIPDWAEGATVTEKGVKYVATPGSYSKIVRKWSDGDFVEINLPIEQMPKQ